MNSYNTRLCFYKLCDWTATTKQPFTQVAKHNELNSQWFKKHAQRVVCCSVCLSLLWGLQTVLCKPCSTSAIAGVLVKFIVSDLPALKERNTRARCVSSKLSLFLGSSSGPQCDRFNSSEHQRSSSLIPTVTITLWSMSWRIDSISLSPRARLILLFELFLLLFYH